MATNAVYKIYNGTSWVEYHFKTNAAQVDQTTGTGWRKFMSASVTVNGQAFGENGSGAAVTINASHINWYGGTKPTTNYLTDAANIQAALVALDTAAKNAFDNIPSGILTTSNYASTLDSVYQAKGSYQAADADLTAIAGLTGTSGFLKKTAANTWSLDTTSYVPTSRTINGLDLSANRVLDGSNIYVSGSSGSTIAGTLSTLTSKVNAMSRAIAIPVDYTQSGYLNTSFSGGSNDATTFTLENVTANSLVHCADGTDTSLFSLDIGDTVFITNVGNPDWWLVSKTESPAGSGKYKLVFQVLESGRSAWVSISGKPTTIAGYGITDAYLDGNTVHLGSNSKTFLTTHQDISGKAPNNHAVNASTYGLGTASVYGHVKLVSGDLNGKTAADGMAASQAHTHSQYLTSHQSLAAYATQTWVDTNFIRLTVGTSAPSNPSTGDVWINI